MTAMIMPSPSMTLRDAARNGFWKNSLAASLAVGLHAIVLALLVHGWTLEKPPLEQPAVLRTQLVMLPPAPKATEPVAAPTPLPEPVAEALIQPVKPAIDPQIQAQKLEQAVLARKRVEDKKRELQAEQQRQRQETEKRTHDLEQQRQAQEQAQEQAQRAEQSRLAAERARQQATQVAADSRQYLPLSKDAPDYPQRALDKNIEGDCTVEYTVNPQGKIENPKVLDGCHPLFMRPSLAAANTFRYQPRIVDGHAVAVPAVRNTFHYRIK
ncbi:TonB family protein [Pseudomonas sp. SWRI79]|uniref:Protein TonB n=1 Tax=Pseudomonas farris TaxID=2841207 RepID=A0ABS6PPJ3_9PSED|nr:energy transducer TonB [Pseudomonas farris]MBV4462388.1 TonB family protein [Pseudomonas farris]